MYVSSDDDDGTEGSQRRGSYGFSFLPAPSTSMDSSVCSSDSESEESDDDELGEQTPAIPQHLSFIMRQRAKALASRGCRWAPSKDEDSPRSGTRHFHVAVESTEWKVQGLYELLDEVKVASPEQRGVIYCSSSRRVQWLAQQLRRRGFQALALCRFTKQHKDLLLRKFHLGQAGFLVCTDRTACCVGELASSPTPLLINFDMARDVDTYRQRLRYSGLHRQQGAVTSFILSKDATSYTHPRDTKALRDVEAYYNTVVEQLPADCSLVLTGV